MNGQSTVNYPTNNNNNNEQLIGKFHVVSVDKLPTNSIGSHDETTTTAGGIQQPPPAAAASSSINDESASASRFQMIRVDRSFARGRWKVNDYEPPENTSIATNPPVNTIENEPVNISNSLQFSTIPSTPLNILSTNVPPGLSGDSNATSSATLAATAASAAAAAATAFQQQHQQQQQRLALTNPATVIPTANVPPPTGLLHGYPPGALANMGAPNQPYMLPNHPQFGYYPFFPPHYSHYAAQWAALAAANPYLTPSAIPPPQQQSMSQLPTGNLGDIFRHMDSVPDVNSENPMISSNPFSNSTNDHLQNAQMAAAASFIYAAHHPHSTYVTQPPPNTASPYATIASYHPVPPPPTIIPPTQPLSLAQLISNNTIDIQQQQQQQQQQSYQAPQSQQQQQQQQAPTLTSPKHDVPSTKTPLQQSTVSKTATTTAQIKPPTTLANGINIDALRTSTTATNSSHITDLLSSSPSILNSQQLPPSLLSPITVPTTNSNNNNNNNSPNKAPAPSLNDIWTYTNTGSPLNLSQAAAQTAAVTAVAAMGLLNNENGKGTEMAHEIFKELTTPTKPNNITDIDNKISAAMDLVKVHLLSAVREEVTELRQQIRTLNEKVNSVEHENTFLRQHVPSEIYAQYTPLPIVSSGANDANNPMANVTTTATNAPSLPPSSSVISSQPIPMASLSSLPASLAQQPSSSTTSQAVPQPLPPPPPPPSSSTTNLPPT